MYATSHTLYHPYVFSSDGENEDGGDDEERMEKRKSKKALVVGESMAGMEEALGDTDTEEALAEFDFLVQESGEGAGEARSQSESTEWG